MCKSMETHVSFERKLNETIVFSLATTQHVYRMYNEINLATIRHTIGPSELTLTSSSSSPSHLLMLVFTGATGAIFVASDGSSANFSIKMHINHRREKIFKLINMVGTLSGSVFDVGLDNRTCDMHIVYLMTQYESIQ